MQFAEMSSGAMPAAGSAAAIGWTVVTLAALLTVIKTAIGLKRDLFGNGKTAIEQPVDVRLVGHLVTKEECVGRHSESTRSVNQLHDQVETLREERKQDNAMVQGQIQSVAREVSGLKTATDMQNQQLARMDSKLDRIVEGRLSRM